jgi:hypothetical protein
MSACIRSLYSSDHRAPGLSLSTGLRSAAGGGFISERARVPAFSFSVLRGDSGLGGESNLFIRSSLTPLTLRQRKKFYRSFYSLRGGWMNESRGAAVPDYSGEGSEVTFNPGYQNGLMRYRLWSMSRFTGRVATRDRKLIKLLRSSRLARRTRFRRL